MFAIWSEVLEPIKHIVIWNEASWLVAVRA